jgi:hypothetical protein
MGLRRWLEQRREKGDAAAVRRAEDEMRSGSLQEREAIEGSVEGLSADNLAERRMGEGSMRNPDRLGGF